MFPCWQCNNYYVQVLSPSVSLCVKYSIYTIARKFPSIFFNSLNVTFIYKRENRKVCEKKQRKKLQQSWQQQTYFYLWHLIVYCSLQTMYVSAILCSLSRWTWRILKGRKVNKRMVFIDKSVGNCKHTETHFTVRKYC